MKGETAVCSTLLLCILCAGNINKEGKVFYRVVRFCIA